MTFMNFFFCYENIITRDAFNSLRRRRRGNCKYEKKKKKKSFPKETDKWPELNSLERSLTFLLLIQIFLLLSSHQWNAFSPDIRQLDIVWSLWKLGTTFATTVLLLKQVNNTNSWRNCDNRRRRRRISRSEASWRWVKKTSHFSTSVFEQWVVRVSFCLLDRV